MKVGNREKFVRDLFKKVDTGDNSLNTTHFINDVLQNEDVKTYVAQMGTEVFLIDCGAAKCVVGNLILMNLQRDMD